MAPTVHNEIEALQFNPDYVFEEMQMPYDLTLKARGRQE